MKPEQILDDKCHTTKVPKVESGSDLTFCLQSYMVYCNILEFARG